MDYGAASCRDRLTALAPFPDEAVSLLGPALDLAMLDRPRAGMDECLAWRDEIASALSGAAGAPAAEQASGLARLLHGFRGCDRDDDDVRNADLRWVIDNRCGTGDALALLWLDVARKIGLNAEALSFPNRVLLRLADGTGRRIILDPFRRGRSMDAQDLRVLLKSGAGPEAELKAGHCLALGNRDLLLRLRGGIKMRLLRCGRMEEALSIVESMLLFAPNHANLWREAGLMHMRLGRPANAMAALGQFVTRTGNALQRRRAQQMIEDIRLRM